MYVRISIISFELDPKTQFFFCLGLTTGIGGRPTSDATDSSHRYGFHVLGKKYASNHAIDQILREKSK